MSDLVFFATRVPDTNDMSAAQVRHEGKILILITARVKTYFRTPILAIRQMKNCRESRNFILRTTIYKCLVPTPKSFEKCTTKAELYNGESYIKKLYTRLQLQMPLHVPAQLRIVIRPLFDKRRLYVKLTTFLLARTIEN